MVSSQQKNGAVPGEQHKGPAGSSDDTWACERKGMLGHFLAWSWQWQMGSKASQVGYMEAENPGWGEEWVLLWMLCWYQEQSGIVDVEIQENWMKRIPRSLETSYQML